METNLHVPDGLSIQALHCTSRSELHVPPFDDSSEHCVNSKANKEESGPEITVKEMQRYFAAEAETVSIQPILCPSHEQLMESLLDQVTLVDFKEKAGFTAGDEDAKVKNRHYLVIVVEVLLAIATEKLWGLCRRYNLFYTFNRAYWKPIEKDDLKAFLRRVAERMGVERFTARYVGFSNQLFDQFAETAYLPSPVPKHNEVLINLMNGTFEIGPRQQRLRPPDAADFLTHQLPFSYDPQAKAPLFEAFLQKVLPDEQCRDILAEYLGYVFVPAGRLKLEKALLLYGSGANGKSVFFEITTALLGEDNVSHYSLKSLTGEPAYCRAHIGDKLLNYASELSGRLETDTFKQLVSCEPIEARLPHGQPFILKNYAKFIFNCNELPTDVEQTPAYFRRFLIVPFCVTIPESEQDKELATKIIASELSGVFNWMLAGLRRLLAQGHFTDCQAVHDQLEAFKQQSDSVRLFLADQAYEPTSDPKEYVLLQDIYRQYRAYCLEDGLQPVKKGKFLARLHTIGILTDRINKGNIAFVCQKLSFKQN